MLFLAAASIRDSPQADDTEWDFPEGSKKWLIGTYPLNATMSKLNNLHYRTERIVLTT
jgi:hypothetical protein